MISVPRMPIAFLPYTPSAKATLALPSLDRVIATVPLRSVVPVLRIWNVAMRHVFRDPVPAPTSALSPMAVAPKPMQSVTLQICASQYLVPAPTFVPMIPTAFVSFAGTVSSILARTAMMAIPEAMTAAHHSVLARYLLQAWLSAATESPTRASSVMMAIFAREMAAPIPASAKRSWWQEQLSVVTARFPPPRRGMMATPFPGMV